MNKDDFGVVFDQGYQAGYGSGLALGCICGIILTGCSALIYWLLVR